MELKEKGWEVVWKEFPSLKEIVERDLEDSVQTSWMKSYFNVRRIDKNLLTKVPTEFYWTGSMVQIEEWEKVHFVLGDKVEYFAVQPAGESGSNYAYSSHDCWSGESIVNALDRLNIKTLPFIVVTTRSYDSVEGQEEINEYKVTVYKAREDTPALIKKLIARERFRAMVKVEREVMGEE